VLLLGILVQFVLVPVTAVASDVGFEQDLFLEPGQVLETLCPFLDDDSVTVTPDAGALGRARPGPLDTSRRPRNPRVDVDETRPLGLDAGTTASVTLVLVTLCEPIAGPVCGPEFLS